MRYTVIFDACVLYPAPLRDFLLRLSTTGLFSAKWTDQIHDEWIRNLLKARPELDDKLSRTRILMNKSVPDSLVTGYEPLIENLALPDTDDRLESISDQWGFLSNLPCISMTEVERITTDAMAHGQVVGLQVADTKGDEVDASPWLKSPSRKPKCIPITKAIPHRVKGVLSQRLYIEKEGLPSPLINLIKRLAAFQNPEFYKKQSLRLSTALTPRIISCAEDHGKYLSLLRGCFDDVQKLLHEHRSDFEMEDQEKFRQPHQCQLFW